MNPPHSTISPSPASSIHTKEYAASSSTHTSYTARAHSNKSVRSAIHSLSPLGSEETIIQSTPPHRNSKSKSTTTSTPLSSPTKTRTRRRKKHHQLHRNFSRTTSTPSVDTYTSSRSSTLSTSETRTSTTTRSSSSPPPYSRHPPSVSTRARIPKRLQQPRAARTLATLDDLGALLFFRLPLYLGGRKTVYVLDDLGIWGFLRPVRRLGALYERVEERWCTWRDWR